MLDFPTELLKEPVPLFPLPDCVLLPGAVLPLNIFEPRYRKMVNEVLEQDEPTRLIAIALLQDGFEPLYETNHAAIHRVVCVGRILHHERLPNGRFNILLLGCCRASVVTEDSSGDYRLAHLTPFATEGELDEQEVSIELAALLAQAVESQVCSQELVKMLVEAASTIAALIDLVAFHFIPGSESRTKQKVLAHRNVAVRSTLVTGWLRALLDRARQAPERRSDGRQRGMN